MNLRVALHRRQRVETRIERSKYPLADSPRRAQNRDDPGRLP